MRLILFGAPGSGKGTQGTFMSEMFGIPRLSPGDILRENRRRGTALGKTAEGYMDRGELVPDSLIIDLIRDRLQEPDAANGFILDGFPRTIPQAEALDGLMSELGSHLDWVIYLRVSEEKLLERLGGRWTCPTCNQVYSPAVPPSVEGVCDNDGTPLEQRDDDRPEAVSVRIEVYNEETAPVLDFYRRHHNVVEVNGERPVDEIREYLASLLGGGSSGAPLGAALGQTA
jgi:adenylate kinase